MKRAALWSKPPIRMPFGCHHGQRLVDLPHSYLEWLLGLPDLREPLRSALRREAERRIRSVTRALDRSPGQTQPTPRNQDDRQDAVEEDAREGEPRGDGGAAR